MPARRKQKCNTCRQRKIKCDAQTPACSQCIRSGWTCPGYSTNPEFPIENATIWFTGEFKTVTHPAIGIEDDQEYSNDRVICLLRPVSPGFDERGSSFFLRRYLVHPHTESHFGEGGYYGYIPNLLYFNDGMTSSQLALYNITAAAGLAALGNSTGVSTPGSEVYRLFGSTLRQLHRALQDPAEVLKDETLATVLLLSTYENILSGNSDSIRTSWKHGMAAMELIRKRGPDQFRRPMSVDIFRHFRAVMFNSAHSALEPIPSDYLELNRWVGIHNPIAEFQQSTFLELNILITAFKAKLKYENIRDPTAVAETLLPLDNAIAVSMESLEEAKKPEIRPLLPYQLQVTSEDLLDTYYETFADPQAAIKYNHLRALRSVIHETILFWTIKFGTCEQLAGLDYTINVLRDMAQGICASSAYQLGLCWPDEDASHVPEQLGMIKSAIGPWLVWPLFVSGMSLATGRDQKLWIARRLRLIATTLGLHLAHSLAETLEDQNLESYYESDRWALIDRGEWQLRTVHLIEKSDIDLMMQDND